MYVETDDLPILSKIEGLHVWLGEAFMCHVWGKVAHGPLILGKVALHQLDDTKALGACQHLSQRGDIYNNTEPRSESYIVFIILDDIRAPQNLKPSRPVREPKRAVPRFSPEHCPHGSNQTNHQGPNSDSYRTTSLFLCLRTREYHKDLYEAPISGAVGERSERYVPLRSNPRYQKGAL